MTYDLLLAKNESPTGEDNTMGSGAFSRFQFMPATAVELARKTAWGAGATPENIKQMVIGTPGRDKELLDLYNARSKAALSGAGLPATNATMLALHRFGQAGGTSLLKANPAMSVTDWVNSVNWGPGVAASEVIRQNRLDRWGNVGDMRRGFIGTSEAPVDLAEAIPQGRPAPTQAEPPLFVEPAKAALDPATALSLAAAFNPVPVDRKKRKQQRLFV